MTYRASSKEVNDVVNEAVRRGAQLDRRRTGHAVLIAPNGRRVPLPGSRAHRNAAVRLRGDLRKAGLEL